MSGAGGSASDGGSGASGSDKAAFTGNAAYSGSTKPSAPPGGGATGVGSERDYWIDTGGADIDVPGDEQYQYDDSQAMQDYMEDYAQNVMKEALPTGGFKEDTGGVGTGGTGTGGVGANVPGTPIVPEGITAAEAAQSFEDAKAAEIAKVQAAAAASGAPFEHYYVGGDPTAEQEKFMEEAGAAASMVGREAWPAAYGGRARQRYGLGSLVKSITKPIKKILKSPIGQAALLGGLGLWGGQAGLFGKGIQDQGWKKFLGSKILGTATRTKHPEGHIIEGDRVGGLWNWIKDNPMLAAAGLSATPFLFQEEEKGTDFANMDYGKKLDLLGIRKKVLDKKATRSEFPYLNPDQYAVAAQGGRIGYQDGRSVRSVALNQLYGIMPKRKLAQEGGLMDLGGMEKDYRNEGGFVPIGGQERADDVPARLSKNEFVFTADAVRNAGGGDIDKGAEIMENLMENLEQGGKVSEESQGLEGARNMFATSQRLEGVL